MGAIRDRTCIFKGRLRKIERGDIIAKYSDGTHWRGHLPLHVGIGGCKILTTLRLTAKTRIQSREVECKGFPENILSKLKPKFRFGIHKFVEGIFESRLLVNVWGV